MERRRSSCSSPSCCSSSPYRSSSWEAASMDVFRDLLDKQIEDRDDERMGRVDALVCELRANGPPVITDLEVGGVSVARRIHPRLEHWAEQLHKKLGVR